jgi:hypothetical protein
VGWLLAKLGLQLADGAGAGRLIAVLTLVAVTVVAGGAFVWYVADLGKRVALAACDREKAAERDARVEAQTAAREANRDVIVRHTADTTRLAAALPVAKEEAKSYVEANPQLVLCGLDDRGLRIWNADPLDARLPDRPAAPGTEPPEAAARQGRGAAGVDRQPDRIAQRLQGAVAQAPGPRR